MSIGIGSTLLDDDETGMFNHWLEDIPDDHEWRNPNCTCDMCLNNTIEEKEDLEQIRIVKFNKKWTPLGPAAD